MLALLIALALWAVEAQAQTPDVCRGAPAAGAAISCTEASSSTTYITINAGGVDIDTTAPNAHAVYGKHEGTAAIDIDVHTSSEIDTTGGYAYGVYGYHTGTGNVDIDVREMTDITTNGIGSHAVYGHHEKSGNINIHVDDSTINRHFENVEDTLYQIGIRGHHLGEGKIDILVEDTTTNSNIAAEHYGSGDSTVRVIDSTIDSGANAGISNQHVNFSDDPSKAGGLSLTEVAGTSITLSGNYGSAILGIISETRTDGNVQIDIRDTIIKTTGTGALGINGRNQADVGNVAIDVHDSMVESVSFGITARRDISGRGAVTLDVQDTEITTTGPGGRGIYVRNASENATLDDVHETLVENSTITTQGAVAHGIEGEHTGIGNIKIRTLNADIMTLGTDIVQNVGTFSFGIYANHKNTGNIDINVQRGSIETRGAHSYGIRGDMAAGNGGEIKIVTGGGNTITTTGDNAHGIVAYHFGTMQETSRILIDVGGNIMTTGAGAQGVRVGTLISGAPARVAAIGEDDYRQQTVTVNGAVTSAAEGVFLAGGGRVIIGSKGSILSGAGIAILATGDTPGANPMVDPAIKPKLRVDMNLNGRKVAQVIGDDWIINDGGETTIAVNRVVLHDGATGVTGRTASNGAWNVRMRAEGVTVDRMDPANWVVTDPAENVIADRDFSAQDFNERRKPPPRQTVMVDERVFGGPDDQAGVLLEGDGEVYIGPEGSVGAESGIAILATGDSPELLVDMNLNGRRVAEVIGDDWIINDGGETTIAVNRVVLHDGATGVTGRTASNGAWNVRMRAEGVTVDRTDPANWVVTDPAENVIADRDFSAQDFNERRKPPPPPPPPPPPMRQTVMVDERVFGGPDDQAGVYLEGDGEVYIGPEGSVGAESGIAILATGDSPELLVDMNLNGRRVAEVIGDDWIINDGGETTIVVNDVTLHDGATGVVEDAVAPNGGNVRVTQRGRRATGVVKDAMAPNGAFNVTMRPEGVTVRDRSDPDPANWVITEPATGVIVDRDFSARDFIETPTRGGLQFMEEYAPRAAVYEALPDFLLRLTGQGPSRTCSSVPDEPVWVRFAGGQGSYEADRSTTGATYNLERFETEGGLSVAFNDTTKGWVSVRHVWGAAGIGSPTGGGQIDVRGLGSSVGGAWQSATGAYAKGCFSYMAYNVDFASHQRGLLKAGTNGRAYTLDVEAGRRFALTGEVHLTPRVWVVGSRVSVDSFTDAVDARVSFADANRIIGGLGFVADTTRPWGEGEFVLRGSVDVERLLSGVETHVQVSGERLSAEATEHGLRFGLNGVYRQGRFSIGAEVAARQELGSDDSEYAGFLNFGLRF